MENISIVIDLYINKLRMYSNFTPIVDSKIVWNGLRDPVNQQITDALTQTPRNVKIS